MIPRNVNAGDRLAGMRLHDKKDIPAAFNSIAKRYDLATLLSQGYQQDLQTSVDRMKLKGQERIADLCCGTGKSTIACLNNLPGGTVIGIDNSEGMLRVAQKKLSEQVEHGQVRFMQQDVMTLTLDGGRLDAIFMAYGIRNMPDVARCLRNLRRLLKPGGTICFHEYAINKSVFARWYWRCIGYGIILPFAGMLTGSTAIFRYLIGSVERFLSPEEFVALLREEGFEDVNHTPLGGWRKPILHTFLAHKPLA
jgi:ubiquinone/menaquinone biosynthesis methyltransferase